MPTHVKPLYIVSYYTPTYRLHAERLEASCHRFDLETEIVSIPSLGSWEANCCFKPTFLKHMLEKRKRPIMWVDSDGEFVKSPGFTCEKDYSAFIHEDLAEDHPSKLMSSTLIFNPTPATFALLDAWIEECATHKLKLWDQAALRNVRHLAENDPLPQSYVAFFDRENHDPHIIHHQASRLQKKILQGEVAELKLQSE